MPTKRTGLFAMRNVGILGDYCRAQRRGVLVFMYAQMNACAEHDYVDFLWM